MKLQKEWEALQTAEKKRNEHQTRIQSRAQKHWDAVQGTRTQTSAALEQEAAERRRELFEKDCAREAARRFVKEDLAMKGQLLNEVHSEKHARVLSRSNSFSASQQEKHEQLWNTVMERAEAAQNAKTEAELQLENVAARRKQEEDFVRQKEKEYLERSTE